MTIKVCQTCVRGDEVDIKFYKETGKWPKEKQLYLCGYDGCKECGGYGHVASRQDCICGKEIWHSPEPYTWYLGKIRKTWNREQIIHIEDGWVCLDCFKGD